MKIVPQTPVLTAAMRAYERAGRYAEAFDCLADIWTDVKELPDTNGLSRTEAGEIFLRCGSVAGLLGRFRHDSVAQENSKNLFTRARDIFIELNDKERIVEAENGLAMAYLRTGEYPEAELWINSALAVDLSPSSFVRLETFICKSVILIELAHYDKAQSFLNKVSGFFDDYDDDYLNGCFATNLGIAEMKLGNIPASMQMYSLARYHHKKSGHLIYLATVENNLAYLYKLEGRLDLAYESLVRSRKLHKESGDISRLGFSFDTEADLLMAEGRLDDAAEAIDKGLDLLRKTEFTEFLIESLVTKMKILAAKGDVASAAIAFHEAAGYARGGQGETRVASLANEFERLVKHSGFSGLGRIFSERIISDENLELELPPSLAMYTDFDAVWIKNSDLENAGLLKGTLALVVDMEIEKGEIAALVENGCEDVVCGYFDEEFGVVAVTNDKNFDPHIFPKESVEILGKIVGFADPEDRRDGKLTVKPLKRI